MSICCFCAHVVDSTKKKSIPTYIFLCISVSIPPPLKKNLRWHTGDVYLLGLVSLVGVQQCNLWKRPQDEAEDAEGPAGPQHPVSTHSRLPVLHGPWVQHGGWAVRNTHMNPAVLVKSSSAEPEMWQWNFAFLLAATNIFIKNVLSSAPGDRSHVVSHQNTHSVPPRQFAVLHSGWGTSTVTFCHILTKPWVYICWRIGGGTYLTPFCLRTPYTTWNRIGTQCSWKENSILKSNYCSCAHHFTCRHSAGSIIVLLLHSSTVYTIVAVLFQADDLDCDWWWLGFFSTSCSLNMKSDDQVTFF